MILKNSFIALEWNLLKHSYFEIHLIPAWRKTADFRIGWARIKCFRKVLIYIFHTHALLHQINNKQNDKQISLSRPRIYEHRGKNPGIIYWQIRKPATINMCSSFWIVSLVAKLEREDQMFIFTTAPALPCLHIIIILASETASWDMASV